MASTLLVSLWDLCIENLPLGRFERREVSAVSASAMIRAARATGRLVCVCSIDLLAPYHARERRRHEDLCAMLHTRHDVPLSLEDFFSAAEDEGRNIMHTTPLEAAELHNGDCLLVVSCNNQLKDTRHETDRVDDRFTIAEDSLSFDIIEALA